MVESRKPHHDNCAEIPRLLDEIVSARRSAYFRNTKTPIRRLRELVCPVRHNAVRFACIDIPVQEKPMARANSPTRNARLEARITAEQKELIERAAAYEGRSVSDFVVATVQQAAKDVVQEHELLRLNKSQSRTFVETLLNPPEPNEALQQAAAEYRRDVVSR
jgi:uncharacterized protein (DUF1778 family)